MTPIPTPTPSPTAHPRQVNRALAIVQAIALVEARQGETR
jgi:hypothetical protein